MHFVTNGYMETNIVALENMKSRIDGMPKIHHIEILKLLQDFPEVKLNENKSGVYVNLSFLPDPVIEKINKYLAYIQEQESTLHGDESQKSNFKKTFFDEHM